MPRQYLTRYQHCPWYERLWRRARWQWNLPYVALMLWAHEKTRPLHDEHDWRASWRNMWGLAVGLSQVNMNHVYDWSESQSWLHDGDEKDER